jgi:AP-3 complex subunit beta
VKLQIISLAAKLVVLCPADHHLGLLSHFVFSLAKYDSNYDVRDRARMLVSLLAGLSPSLDGEESRGGVILRREQVKLVLFDGKDAVAEEVGINAGLF